MSTQMLWIIVVNFSLSFSNATVIDDNGMVEFPRRKKSDASIYEDLMKHQNKMQNRGDRRSVPNILAGLQGSFQILQGDAQMQ